MDPGRLLPLLLTLAACGAAAEPAPTVAIAAAAPPTAAPEERPPAARPAPRPAVAKAKDAKDAGEGPCTGTGVPECDDYFRVVEDCVSRQAALGPAMRAATTSNCAAWRQAAATPAGRSALAAACKAGRDALASACPP